MPRRADFPRGMGMRYVAYEEAGARLGVLPDTLAGTFTCPRQETPSLSLSYPNGEQGVRGILLDQAIEVAVELTYDGETWVEPPNARFMNLSSSWNLVEEGTEHRTADFIHIGQRLDGALVWAVPAVAADKDGKYKFNSRNAGRFCAPSGTPPSSEAGVRVSRWTSPLSSTPRARPGPPVPRSPSIRPSR